MNEQKISDVEISDIFNLIWINKILVILLVIFSIVIVALYGHLKNEPPDNYTKASIKGSTQKSLQAINDIYLYLNSIDVFYSSILQLQENLEIEKNFLIKKYKTYHKNDLTNLFYLKISDKILLKKYFIKKNILKNKFDNENQYNEALKNLFNSLDTNFYFNNVNEMQINLEHNGSFSEYLVREFFENLIQSTSDIVATEIKTTILSDIDQYYLNLNMIANTLRSGIEIKKKLNLVVDSDVYKLELIRNDEFKDLSILKVNFLYENSFFSPIDVINISYSFYSYKKNYSLLYLLASIFALLFSIMIILFKEKKIK